MYVNVCVPHEVNVVFPKKLINDDTYKRPWPACCSLSSYYGHMREA